MIVGISVREASQRFPNKCMALIGGKPSFHFLYDRCKYSGINAVVLTSEKCKKIINHCKSFGIPYLATQTENDVFGRFYKLALQNPEKNIARCTGDDIFFLPDNAKKMFKKHIESNSDYTYPLNHIKGTEIEIMSSDKIIEIYNSLDNLQRLKSEYLTWFFKNVPSIKSTYVDLGHKSGYRVELDTIQDYYLRVLPLFYSHSFYTQQEIESYFDKNKTLQGK